MQAIYVFSFLILVGSFYSSDTKAAAISPEQWPAIKTAVANDIDALVGDTVNEGETEAYVLWRGKGKNKAPVVICSNKSLPERQMEVLRCAVTFRVKTYDKSIILKDCDLTYLLHTNKKPFPHIVRGHEAIFNRCLEALGEE